MQWPKPTLKPVARYITNKVLIGDVKDKLHRSQLRNCDCGLPNSTATGTPNNQAHPLVKAVAHLFEKDAIGPHVHTWHPKIDIGGGRQVFHLRVAQ